MLTTGQASQEPAGADSGPLRIGELARQTGITVRTLHHYDRLGLLSPSQRTSGGHRCYTADDVRRLHHIIALRSFGLSLEKIKAVLDTQPRQDPAELLRTQLDVVNERIRQLFDLRLRLTDVLDALDHRTRPSTEQFLQVIEETMTANESIGPEQLPTLVEARRRKTAHYSDEEMSAMTRRREPSFAELGEQERARLRERLHESYGPPARRGAIEGAWLPRLRRSLRSARETRVDRDDAESRAPTRAGLGRNCPPA
ncbi:MerR family transcriptional regulator [Kitasatospora sp. NPDC058190]|uniref:MerR family transcriptional regulator n=1 Tax=Kitasatospora sp. NPDC058190 TaxID=3346371 RepID=UPI0036D871A7